MHRTFLLRLSRATVVGVLLSLAAIAPARADFNLCPTFDSCTAGLLSDAASGARYTMPIVAISSDSHQTDTHSPVSASVGECVTGICGGTAPYASAAAQTDFGLNRAVGRTGPGFPIGGRAVQTLATATSTWRDVLSFSGNGRANAVVSLDGTVGIGQGGGPSSLGSGWDYSLTVYDLSDLVADVEGFFVPRVVAAVSTGAWYCPRITGPGLLAM